MSDGCRDRRWHITFPQPGPCPSCNEDPVDETDVAMVTDWAQWRAGLSKGAKLEPIPETIAEVFLYVAWKAQGQT